MLTSPLRELPPSSVATLEKGISGGTVALLAAAAFCCARLHKLHDSTMNIESIAPRSCFIKPPFTGLVRSAFFDLLIWRRPWTAVLSVKTGRVLFWNVVAWKNKREALDGSPPRSGALPAGYCLTATPTS